MFIIHFVLFDDLKIQNRKSTYSLQQRELFKMTIRHFDYQISNYSVFYKQNEI
jgi:hypothetical protein